MEKKDLFRLMADKAIVVMDNHPEVKVNIFDHSGEFNSLSMHMEVDGSCDSLWVELNKDEKDAISLLDRLEDITVRLIKDAEARREKRKTDAEKLAEANEKIAELEAKLEVYNNAAV